MIYAYSEECSAPEAVFNKFDAIEEKADYYSFGAILYEMATKRKPTLEWVLFDEAFDGDVDEEVKDLVWGMMQENLSQRHLEL